MFWESQRDANGNPKPKHFYYDLCQRTVLNNNPKAQIINMDEAKEIIGGIPDEIKDHYIVHQVDWIRKMLIYKQGGLYLDSDFICLRPLDVFLDIGKHIDMALPKQSDSRWMDNFLVGKKGSEPIKHAADVALRKMTNKKPSNCKLIEGKNGRQGQSNLGWLEPNANAMWETIQYWNRRSLIMQIPTSWIHPLPLIKDWFFSPRKNKGIPYKNSCFGYITSFHVFRDRINKFKSEKDLLESDTRVADLIRHGLT